jgi:phosphatidylserine/phosphatidylglycerophosphate/cardiolipin synthase-like enzyme
MDLIESDANRRQFKPKNTRLVISPENSRSLLAAFIKRAQRELLIYDPNVSDDAMIRILKARAKAGVRVRILGKLEKKWQGDDLPAEGLQSHRLHVRAIIRDGRQAFVGSQSLRKLELEGRREVGIILKDPKAVSRLVSVFEADWAKTPSAKSHPTKAKQQSAR